MADCSASGTAIDRAVAALGQTNETGKHLSSLLGHVAVGSNLNAGTDLAMLAAPPPTLDYLPQQQQQQQPPLERTITAPPHSASLENAWMSSVSHVPAVQHNTTPPMMAMMMHHQQQQQMQQHFMMMQQQQQQQMIMHDLFLKEQKEKQNQLKEEMVATQHQENLGDWHKDLEQEVEKELATGDSSIEELAAAWAQAEKEYQEEFDYLEHFAQDPQQVTEWQHPSYEFVNKLATDQHDHTKDWMDIGLTAYKQGNIREAVQAFETLLQMDDSHAKAWYYLGKCHAENDQDVQAIACLERSVERDPFRPETLLALGVSYVNELNHRQALQSLKEWITHNPNYAGLDQLTSSSSNHDDLYGSLEGNHSELDQVQRLLVQALEHEPTPEVHEALGVVYNVSRDYHAAVSSFQEALKSRPEEYSLWNKLGATLANSDKSDEAIPNYHQALKLRPRYARAWLNMAISHSNMQNYSEAARCYLQTLSLNPGATHCWSYLRIALSCMERWDLLPLVSSQDIAAFSKHFDFVLDTSTQVQKIPSV